MLLQKYALFLDLKIIAPNKYTIALFSPLKIIFQKLLARLLCTSTVGHCAMRRTWVLPLGHSILDLINNAEGYNAPIFLFPFGL